MTAVRARRTRSTVIALVAACVGLAAAAVLGVAGVRSLSDSTAGRRAEGQAAALASQRLPFTVTAFVGVADEDGRLTSAAVWVLEPTGIGGKIVSLAGSADSASGTRDTIVPLATALEVGGADEFLAAAERLTGLTFDVVEVLDERRFAQIVGPLGDLPVLFPVDFEDASSGEAWEAGETTLSSPAVARAMAATDPGIADWAFEPARAALWEAIAERVGAGIGSVPPVADDRAVPVPGTLDQFADRLFAAPVEHRAIGFRPIDPERVAEQLPPGYADVFGPLDAVVAHDRAELVILLGAVAPGRLGAPLDAPVFRIVSHFDDAEADAFGMNRTDVLRQAVDRLFFAQANIVSVADLPAEPAPEVTQLRVADPTTTGAVREVYEPLFGDVEVLPAEVRIEGVDIEVVLGRSFLDEARGDSAPAVAGLGDDDSTDDDSTDDGTSDR